MITNNFRLWLNMAMVNPNVHNLNTGALEIQFREYIGGAPTPINLGDSNGDLALYHMQFFAPYSSESATNITSISSNDHEYGLFIALGSGDTAPSESDYKLDSAITNLTTIGGSVSYKNNANTYIICTQTFSNETTEPITVKELGLYAHLGKSYAVTYWSRYLFVREVLPTPVTINPGEIYTFTMTLK